MSADHAVAAKAAETARAPRPPPFCAACSWGLCRKTMVLVIELALLGVERTSFARDFLEFSSRLYRQGCRVRWYFIASGQSLFDLSHPWRSWIPQHFSQHRTFHCAISTHLSVVAQHSHPQRRLFLLALKASSGLYRPARPARAFPCQEGWQARGSGRGFKPQKGARPKPNAFGLLIGRRTLRFGRVPCRLCQRLDFLEVRIHDAVVVGLLLVVVRASIRPGFALRQRPAAGKRP